MSDSSIWMPLPYPLLPMHESEHTVVIKCLELTYNYLYAHTPFIMSVLNNKNSPLYIFFFIWVLKLCEHQQTLFPLLSSSFLPFCRILCRLSGCFLLNLLNMKNMKCQRCSLEVCPFFLTSNCNCGIMNAIWNIYTQVLLIDTHNVYLHSGHLNKTHLRPANT